MNIALPWGQQCTYTTQQSHVFRRDYRRISSNHARAHAHSGARYANWQKSTNSTPSQIFVECTGEDKQLRLLFWFTFEKYWVERGRSFLTISGIIESLSNVLQGKNSSNSINFWDISTNVISIYSVCQVPSRESKCILLASVSKMPAYLSMLFIFELACSTCIAGHRKNLIAYLNKSNSAKE